MTVDQLLLQITHFTDTTVEEFLPRRDARVLRSLSTLMSNGTFFTENQIQGIVNSGTFDASSPLFSKARELYSLNHTPVVGASGAVFGLLLAYGMSFPNQIIYLNFFFPINLMM